jgi:hypothetical protein
VHVLFAAAAYGATTLADHLGNWHPANATLASAIALGAGVLRLVEAWLASADPTTQTPEA